MSGRERRAIVMVVGVGRSGTSLAMQALIRLGAYVSHNVVPPSENNIRGTGEDIALRDHMFALHGALGNFQALRPDDWLERPVTRSVERWATTYLRELVEASGGTVAAMKFPLASLFLPLWQRAARKTEIELRLVWATRDASHTLGSFMSAYDVAIEVAERRYLQRSLYVLRDGSRSTLLLPYEKWQDDAPGQMAALARICGVPAERAAEADLFEPSMSRGGSVEQPRPPVEAIQNFNAVVSGRRCTLRTALGKSSDTRKAYLHSMSAALAKLTRRVEDGAGGAFETARGSRMTVSGRITSETGNVAPQQRLKDLTEELDRRTKEATALRKQVEDDAKVREGLAADLEAAREEIATLRQAYANLTRARDQAEEDMAAERSVLSNRIAEQANELKTHRARNSARSKELRSLIERAAARETRIKELTEHKALKQKRIDELRSANASKQKRIDDLKEIGARKQERIDELRKINAAKGERIAEIKSTIREKIRGRREELIAARSALSAKAAAHEKQVAQLQSIISAEREKTAMLIASARWRAGDVIADARRRPVLGALTVPIRLMRLALGRY